jgi:hypothetical protein
VRRSRPLVLPGEIDAQDGTPGVEPLPLLGFRSGIDAQRGDYTQVGNSVQRALVCSSHQSRSGTYQIYLHPLAYPLLWNHRFPFLPRQPNRPTFYANGHARGAVRPDRHARFDTERNIIWDERTFLVVEEQDVISLDPPAQLAGAELARVHLRQGRKIGFSRNK